MTANDVCPYCGLDFHRAKIDGVATTYTGTCFTCGKVMVFTGVLFYVEEGPGEGQHIFRLSYPYMCDCGKFHSMCTVFCKPIDVTAEFEKIKKGDKNE